MNIYHFPTLWIFCYTLKMKTIKHYFDRAVNTYENAGKIQKKVAEHLLTLIQREHYHTVLEVGVGRGFLTKPLIKKISFERYINLDISYILLKKLKEELPECLYINGRAENISLKSDSVNLLISSSSLHWVENPEETILNLLNLLRENGKFYFSLFLSNSLFELQSVSKISGFGSFYPLKSSDFYIKLLNLMPNIKFQYSISIFKETFPSVKEMLLSHKLTGTNFTKNKKFSGKNSFYRFCKIYENLYGSKKGIYATYEVLFIEGQKISPFPQN